MRRSAVFAVVACDWLQMETDIGNRLSRKKKTREDARRVLEMFLESSLSVDPEFHPSGHYHPNKLSQVRLSLRQDFAFLLLKPIIAITLCVT